LTVGALLPASLPTAIITAQEQPKIQEGTSARVAAKMP
jgi:hypothetical protein